MSRHDKLPVALRNGEFVHINEVPSGLGCGCVCPACGARLIARKGNNRTHHFAHHAGEDCEHGYETSLHLWAKKILSAAKEIWLPAVCVEFPGSYKERQKLYCERLIPVTQVVLEKRFDDIVPDIVVYSGNECFFIEIAVTHPIDDIKHDKIRDANVSTLEIDLSGIDNGLSEDILSNILIGQSDKKRWHYNRKAALCYRNFLSKADRKDFVYRGLTVHVDYCPVNARIWRGKPYASFMENCLSCEYLLFSTYGCDEDSGYIMCSGRSKVSTISDLTK